MARSFTTFTILLSLILIFWGWLNLATHPIHSIISWDEGFHGGAAFFVSEALSHPTRITESIFLARDFINGLIYYLPLWSSIAGILGAIFTPSVEIYRFSTLLFGALSVILLAYFGRSQSGNKAGLFTAIILAFSPIFFIYSHLMMAEVPLLFSVTLALTAFYLYLLKQHPSPRDFYLGILAVAIGTMTKVTAVALIVGVIINFGIMLWLFARKHEITKRFFKPATIFLILVPICVFLFFALINHVALRVDILTAYLIQMRNLSANQNLPNAFIQTLIQNFSFYFRDFSHMPALTFFWFSSFLAYILIKRSILCLFLGSWLVTTYLLFTAVRPQAPQYLLPIFAPLTLGAGLFLGELFIFKKQLINNIIFVFIAVGIIGISYLYLNSSETSVWRNTITYQQEAAKFITGQAKKGDKIAATSDGTRLLLNLADKDKKIEVFNLAKKRYRSVFLSKANWLVDELGPQNPIPLEESEISGWTKIVSFNTSFKPLVIYKKY